MQGSYALFDKVTGKFKNKIEADADFIELTKEQFISIYLNDLPNEQHPSFGWTLVDGVMIPGKTSLQQKMEEEMAKLPPVEPPKEARRVTITGFKKLFGVDAANILTSEHKACRAAKEMLYDAPYVDLDDPLTERMLDSLILTEQPSPDPMFPGSGPMTEEKKLKILTDPIADQDKYTGVA